MSLRERLTECIERAVENQEAAGMNLRVLQDGEEICYAYAEVSKVQYDIIENALIFMNKPSFNEVLRDNYKHQDAEFHFSGKCKKLVYKDFQIVDEVIIPLQQQK